MYSTNQLSKAVSALLILFTFSQSTLTATNAFFDFSDCSKKDESCQGKRTWKDGTVYEGAFKYGQPEGMGTMIWSDGSSYEGQFKDGLRHGEGFQKNNDGSIYKGTFVDGFMHGQGVYSFPCGHEYYGEFYKDKMDGQGSIQFANGSAFTGEWKKGEPDGKGKFLRIDGSIIETNFNDALRSGTGTIDYEGNSFEGTWKKNKLEGASTFTFANGEKLSCTWQKGMMSRVNCIYTFADGTTKKRTVDELLSIHSITQNMVFVLYIDALEQLALKKHNIARTRLIMAKRFVAKDSTLLKHIQDNLRIIANK